MGQSGHVYSCTCLMRLMLGLCPIFMSGVGLPDIHDYSASLRVVNGPLGFGASHEGNQLA